jgi:predicted HAD superfamily phosphohydrolase YqeG
MGGYERIARRQDLLRRARELAAKTVIIDVEPLVAYWDSGQAHLDRGVALTLDEVATLPDVRVVCFATNSAREPSAVPASERVEVRYLASAGKPGRTAPYRHLPEPGVVIGDQVATDGILARRLGYTFLHYMPPRAAMPIGPRLLRYSGRLLLPLVFWPPGWVQAWRGNPRGTNGRPPGDHLSGPDRRRPEQSS